MQFWDVLVVAAFTGAIYSKENCWRILNCWGSKRIKNEYLGKRNR